jgi:branched-chain amino acid transport system permease protein
VAAAFWPVYPQEQAESVRARGMKKPTMLAVAAALITLLLPLVVTNQYYLHILNLAGIYTLITLGLNLLSGYTGQVSMGQAGYFAAGTYVCALLMLNSGVSFWVATIAAAVFCAFCGVVIGVPAMKLSGPYLVLVTVGFGEIIRLVILNWTPVTKGAAGLTGIPLPSVFGFQVVSERDFYYLILFFVVLGTYVAWRLANSKVGRTFNALREDELAAESMGVPVNAYKIAAFAISAVYAGVAGSIYGSFAGVASPDNFTFDDSVGFLCMSVVGGNRTIGGALAGAFILMFLSEALRAFQAYRLVIYGAILIFTVIYMPQGLAGLMDVYRRRRRPEGRP